jgi:Spy/CpxP family protein refolding chaperone
MRMKKTIPIVILMLSFLFLASTLLAQETKPQKKGFKTKLGLAPEQKEKIEDIRFNFQKESIRLKADLKIAKLELKSLMSEEELDKGKIYRKIEELSNLRTKLAKNQVDKKMAIRQILTKEQLEMLKEFKSRRIKREKIMQGKMRHIRPPRRERPFLKKAPYEEKIEKLPPEVGQAPLVEPWETLFELPELLELAQLMDELELPPHPFEELELLPLFEEDLPPLPELPEVMPPFEGK